MSTFNRAREAWLEAASFREARRRFKRYTYGRQWDDLTRDITGKIVTEGELAHTQGRRPATNNMLRALVKSVVGRFRYNLTTSDRPEATERFRAVNQLDELDARMLEEFLISGCAVQRVVYERRLEGEQVWVDNVNPTAFFCNRFLDPRGSDIRLIGQLHEMSLQEMRSRFGHRNRLKLREIDRVYSRSRSFRSEMPLVASSGDIEFDRASDPTLCRVVEVWTLEGTAADKLPAWQCRYYGSEGTLLDETPSPYAHGSHPFVVKLYPLTDGEVHPFIEDVIDQQRHINSLITTIDHILNNSAKGALLFPTDALTPGVNMEKAAQLWGSPGAVIPINPRATRLPTEVNTPGTSAGASQLLDIEMRMFQQISGVTSALQGHDIGGNASASLYDAQATNAAIALMDIFATFDSFRQARDAKALNIS